MKDWRNPKYLKEEFVTKGRSTVDIAKEHGVFPNQVRRYLIKIGIKPRDKSAAQKLNLEQHGHPMQGRQRTESEKENISLGLHNFWHADGGSEHAQNLRERLGNYAREQWDKLDEDERKALITKMHMASNERTRAGSKSENAVAAMLVYKGFRVIQRSKDFTPSRQFEIDIALPDERVAIEWDGATHFMPIYGEERLAEVQEKDGRKDKVLVGAGWTLIRCRDMSTGYSRAFCARTVDAIMLLVKNSERGVVHIIEAR